jgi:hypothetical protein
MDPNANITEQLELATALVDGTLTYDHERTTAGEELAELVLALDEWITRGGFLPGRWHLLDRVDAKAVEYAEALGLPERKCEGHPAGPDDPMGETVYCDGSCRP